MNAPMDRADAEAGVPPEGAVIDRCALFDRLAGAGRVTQVTAPAGSGKTTLLRSWIRDAGRAEQIGWVSVQREESDPQRFWLSVTEALGATAPGSAQVHIVSPAPDLDAWAIVERLLEDLASLHDDVWLVIDDLHELRAPEALHQLELLLMRSPPQLRFVLATRHDQPLGLHRLRLQGGLTEVRASDLRFNVDESRALLEAAGVRVSDWALAQLVERTEGWAAGLRLAALSMAGHEDPDAFAAAFSGSERTVAEYLLAEVLERQTEPVRRLLLRTSVLERVTGPLADALTGGTDGEQILQELEQANAFVVSVDVGRSWFRYHGLFAGLLQRELRRTASADIPTLHAAAAHWYAAHGHPVDAARHALEAGDWGQASRLLADSWVGLYLDGREAILHELVSGFPAGAAGADAELAVLLAADQLIRGSVQAAEGYLALATRNAESVPDGRRGHLQAHLTLIRLTVVRQRNDLPAVLDEAQRLLVVAEGPDTAQLGASDQLRAMALVSLGAAQLWTARLDEAERHLEQAIDLAHRIERPYLESLGLGHWAMVGCLRSFSLGAHRSRRAIALAHQHGWVEEPAVVAYAVLAYALVGQGLLEEAESWLDRAERSLPVELEPAEGVLLHCARGGLELARGRNQAALHAFRAAEVLAETLVVPHALTTGMRGHLVEVLARVGQSSRAEQAIAQLDEQQRETGELRTALAALRLAEGDPAAATSVLVPVLDRDAPVTTSPWLVQAFLLEAIARDALGEIHSSESALEMALDLAESDAIRYPFLIHPAPELLQRHRHATSHASLIEEILNRLAGEYSAPQPREYEIPPERLSRSEQRILGYLPTHLSAPEIANELSLSVHTVKSHMRRLYAKLGTHQRAETVERARALGMLAPSSRQP